MPYMPLRPTAGNILFRLVDRTNNSIVKDFSMYVFDYQDNMLNAENNEIINNVNSNLFDDHYGVRVSIKFMAVNSSNDSSYKQKILWLISMINDINNLPETYKLMIYYRYPSFNYFIEDAIQVGSISLKELSESSNIAQGIVFEFIEKSIMQELYGRKMIYPAAEIIKTYCIADIDVWVDNTFYRYLGSGSILDLNNYIKCSIGDDVNLIIVRNHVTGTSQYLITPNMSNCLRLWYSSNFSIMSLCNKTGVSWRYSINGDNTYYPSIFLTSGSKLCLSVIGQFFIDSYIMGAYTNSVFNPTLYGNNSSNYYGFANGTKYYSTQEKLSSIKVRSMCAAVSSNDMFYVENNDSPLPVSGGNFTSSHFLSGSNSGNVSICGFQVYQLPSEDSVAQTKLRVSAINANSVARYGVV